MRLALNLGARAVALGAFCLCLSFGTFGAPAGIVQSPDVTKANERRDVAHADAMSAVLSSNEYKAALAALTPEEFERDRALAKELADAAKARSAEVYRNVKGRAEDLDARRDLFRAQSYYNSFIFVMVVVVLAAGLWFSYLQFTVDRAPIADLRSIMRELETLSADDPLRPIIAAKLDGSANKTPNALEVGPVKITSNVIGLVVLAMSLVFFYLYLDRVYTIQLERVGLGRETAEQRKDPSANVTGGAEKQANGVGVEQSQK